MDKIIEKWKDLTIRTKFAYISATIAFLAGWVLTYWGFLTPPKGVIDNTVIVVLGQAMVYAACVFGVGEYVNLQIMKHINDKLKTK